MFNTDYSTIVNYTAIGQELIKTEEQGSTHSSLKVDWAVKCSEHVLLFRP